MNFSQNYNSNVLYVWLDLSAFHKMSIFAPELWSPQFLPVYHYFFYEKTRCYIDIFSINYFFLRYNSDNSSLGNCGFQR